METALCLLYLIMGCWSIGYIKHDFLLLYFKYGIGILFWLPDYSFCIITHAGFFQKIVRYKEEYKRKQRKQ